MLPFSLNVRLTTTSPPHIKDFSIGDFGIPSVEQMKKTLDTLDAALQD